MRKDLLTKEEVFNVANNLQHTLIARSCGKEITNRIITEMLAYKNIEEELGIDLITLFKALKNGIYVDPYYIDYATTDNFLCPDNLDYFDINRKQITNEVYFKDYGKTWALTKEELENV